MLPSSRLVRMIEKHAEELTQAAISQIFQDPRAASYHKLDAHEYHSRVFAVVHNFGKWLDSESDTAMEAAYRKLGRKRFREGIPLAEVVCALMLTKQTIRHFIHTDGWMDSALELSQQAELYNLISRFFDRAIYFTVLSYEEQARAAVDTTESPAPQKRWFAAGWGSKKAVGPMCL